MPRRTELACEVPLCPDSPPRLRETSLEPAVKRAMMVVGQTKPSPTRCVYYEARSSAVPVSTGERVPRYDGAVRPDYLLGVATRIRLEVIDRAPRRAARVWSGLDGQPDSQLADTAEPGRGRVGGRSRYPGEGRGVLQGGSRGRDLGNGSQRAQGVGRAVAYGASSESAVGVCGVPVLGDVP